MLDLPLPFRIVGIDDFEHKSDDKSSSDRSRKISGQSDDMKHKHIRKGTGSDFENLSSSES